MRTTKISPTPTSKRISGATRESAQPTMTAGYWPSARARNLGTAPRSSGLSFDETGVAVEEIVPSLVGADGRRGFAGSRFLLRCFLVRPSEQMCGVGQREAGGGDGDELTTRNYRRALHHNLPCRSDSDALHGAKVGTRTQSQFPGIRNGVADFAGGEVPKARRRVA